MCACHGARDGLKLSLNLSVTQSTHSLVDTLFNTFEVPYAIMFLFNTIMFGMVMAALINTQNPLLKSFKRISSTLSRRNSQSGKWHQMTLVTSSL